MLFKLIVNPEKNIAGTNINGDIYTANSQLVAADESIKATPVPNHDSNIQPSVKIPYLLNEFSKFAPK